jgi:hypothetical protein
MGHVRSHIFNWQISNEPIISWGINIQNVSSDRQNVVIQYLIC